MNKQKKNRVIVNLIDNSILTAMDAVLVLAGVESDARADAILRYARIDNYPVDPLERPHRRRRRRNKTPRVSRLTGKSRNPKIGDRVICVKGDDLVGTGAIGIIMVVSNVLYIKWESGILTPNSTNCWWVTKDQIRLL